MNVAACVPSSSLRRSRFSSRAAVNLALQDTLSADRSESWSRSELQAKEVIDELVGGMHCLPAGRTESSWLDGPEVGTVIDGTWVITGNLGAGAFGRVFEAMHLTLGRTDAIKFLNARYASDPIMRQRFVQEARATAKFRGGNIVRIFDHGEHEGVPFLVMERLTGEPLDTLLERNGAMSVARFLEHANGILQALAEVHSEGVVHRDIKPANVFMLADGRGIKLLDFGLAMTSVRMTLPGTLLGTPCYLAPELLSSEAEASQATDIYSVGAVFYAMLTGRPPFVPESGERVCSFFDRVTTTVPRPPSMVRPGIPPEIDRVVMRALARDPACRPRDARSFAEALSATRARTRFPRTIDVSCVPALPALPGDEDIPTEPMKTRVLPPERSDESVVTAIVTQRCPIKPAVTAIATQRCPDPRVAIAVVTVPQYPRVSLIPPMQKWNSTMVLGFMMMLAVGSLMAVAGGFIVGASTAHALLGGLVLL